MFPSSEQKALSPAGLSGVRTQNPTPAITRRPAAARILPLAGYVCPLSTLFPRQSTLAASGGHHGLCPPVTWVWPVPAGPRARPERADSDLPTRGHVQSGIASPDGSHLEACLGRQGPPPTTWPPSRPSASRPTLAPCAEQAQMFPTPCDLRSEGHRHLDGQTSLRPALSSQKAGCRWQPCDGPTGQRGQREADGRADCVCALGRTTGARLPQKLREKA